jgi:ferredoxin
MVFLHQIAGTSQFDLYSVDGTLNHIRKKQKRKIYINTCACISGNCFTCEVEILRGGKNVIAM